MECVTSTLLPQVQPSVATARVLADSVDSAGFRLTTVEATFARSALAELNTHRAFSRNSASSRAIPVKKLLQQAEETPFIPRRFSLGMRGMHTNSFIQAGDPAWDVCLGWWLESRDSAVLQAKRGLDLGLHKQDVNRLIEPFLSHTAIISATDWDNFFTLRLATDEDGNPLAYPPIYDLAKSIQEALDGSQPAELGQPGMWAPPPWHLPLRVPEDSLLTVAEQVKVCVARCARVSYLTHDGRRDVQADLDLYERLRSNGHWSPFEHVAHPHMAGSGNFKGWRQARFYVEAGVGPL
jgi:thymidylate synthase ThyX